MLATAGRLGVMPNFFWRLSLTEWRALIAQLDVAETLPRANFDALAARFPDMGK